jgi:hypothetical protein
MSAMPALTRTDRERLAKLLGMLGSQHAGERDNAALAIERLRRELGLSWDARPLATGPSARRGG